MTAAALDADALQQAAYAFADRLDAIKQAIGPDFPWYPYKSLGNFTHLKLVMAGTTLDALVSGGPVLDIGAADGEVAFFLESLGYKAAIVDHAPTNYNSLRGARMIADHLQSSVTIDDVDLDTTFDLPARNYNLIFFLGILYHLKNPFFALERLAESSRHLLLSTRVARFAPSGEPIRDLSVGYLLGSAEANNDATNFWIFSEAGLRQLIHRTGWDIVRYATVGDTATSDPARSDRDERAFALLRSRHFA